MKKESLSLKWVNLDLELPRSSGQVSAFGGRREADGAFRQAYNGLDKALSECLKAQPTEED